jgi:putative flippase GtrA
MLSRFIANKHWIFRRKKHTTQVVNLLGHLFNVLLGFLDKVRIWTQAL